MLFSATHRGAREPVLADGWNWRRRGARCRLPTPCQLHKSVRKKSLVAAGHLMPFPYMSLSKNFHPRFSFWSVRENTYTHKNSNNCTIDQSDPTVRPSQRCILSRHLPAISTRVCWERLIHAFDNFAGPAPPLRLPPFARRAARAPLGPSLAAPLWPRGIGPLWVWRRGAIVPSNDARRGAGRRRRTAKVNSLLGTPRAAHRSATSAPALACPAPHPARITRLGSTGPFVLNCATKYFPFPANSVVIPITRVDGGATHTEKKSSLIQQKST